MASVEELAAALQEFLRVEILANTVKENLLATLTSEDITEVAHHGNVFVVC